MTKKDENIERPPPLRLVRSTTNLPDPPRSLGQHGQSLWRRIQSEYAVEDSGGVELLALACQALDRAESLRKQVDRDGELIRVRGGMLKEHPGLKAELSNRSFVVRTLTKLGLDVEPVRPTAGRPGVG